MPVRTVFKNEGKVVHRRNRKRKRDVTPPRGIGADERKDLNLGGGGGDHKKEKKKKRSVRKERDVNKGSETLNDQTNKRGNPSRKTNCVYRINA